MTQLYEQTIGQCKSFLHTLVEREMTKTPTLLLGAPGIGKSSIVYQVAADLGYKVIIFRVSDMAPNDIRGIPYIVQHPDGTQEFKYVSPTELPNLKRDGEKVILCLDEFTNATPAVMSIAQQLLLDRRIGQYYLPEGVMIIALGNQKKDGSNTHAVPSTVGNRLRILEVKISVDDFTAWAVKNGIDARIVAYVNWDKSKLYEYSRGDIAFPSPRSWASANELLPLVDDSFLSHISFEYLGSSLGVGAAANFEAYCSVFADLPNIKDIYAKGEKSKEKIPGWGTDKVDLNFAVISALALSQSGDTDLLNAIRWVNAQTKDRKWLVLLRVLGIELAKTIDGGKAARNIAKACLSDKDMSEILKRHSVLKKKEEEFN